jgi:hypothetical protein
LYERAKAFIAKRKPLIIGFLAIVIVFRLYNIVSFKGGDLLFIPLSQTVAMYYGYLACWLLATFFVFSRTILKWRSPSLPATGNLVVSGT